MRVVSTKPYGSGPRDGARAVGRMTAIASIGAGMVHVAAAADHSEMALMMVGFELVAILQVALGCILFWRLANAPLLAGGLALMIVSIALWIASRTIGLGFIEGAHPEPVGFRDSVAVLFELVSCVGLWELLRGSVPAMAPRLGAAPVGLAATLAIALAIPAILTGGHGHSPDGADGFVHAGAGSEHATGVGLAAGHDVPAAAHDPAGSGDHPRGSHRGRRSSGDGDGGHPGHSRLASAAHGHGGGDAGDASAAHLNAAVPVADHTHPAGAAPGDEHAVGGGHGAAGGSHGGSTGSGHAPPEGGGHPPSHGEHPPPPAEPPPEQSLTDVVTEPLDPVLPGRRP